MSRRVVKKKEKKIITIESGYLTEGLFGIVLTWPLEILFLLKNYDIKPNFIIRTKNYGIEENDFNIVSKLIHLNYVPQKSTLPKELKQFLTREDKDNFYLSLKKIKSFNDTFQPQDYLKDVKEVNKVFFTYFNIDPSIFEKLSDKICHDTLGIHIRGTDKKIDRYMNPEDKTTGEIFKNIDMLLKKKKFSKIFLATDSSEIYEEFKNNYKNLEIISNDCVRFKSTESPFRTVDETNPYEKRKFKDSSYNIESGKNAILDSISLSLCRMVLLNNSALSSWSKVFNPNLEIYRLNSIGDIKWFPYYYIPMFEIDKIE